MRKKWIIVFFVPIFLAAGFLGLLFLQSKTSSPENPIPQLTAQIKSQKAILEALQALEPNQLVSQKRNWAKKGEEVCQKGMSLAAELKRTSQKTESDKIQEAQIDYIQKGENLFQRVCYYFEFEQKLEGILAKFLAYDPQKEFENLDPHKQREEYLGIIEKAKDFLIISILQETKSLKPPLAFSSYPQQLIVSLEQINTTLNSFMISFQTGPDQTETALEHQKKYNQQVKDLQGFVLSQNIWRYLNLKTEFEELENHHLFLLK